MQGLKKFGLVTAIVLFGPLFLLSVFSIAINRTLGDEAYTKRVIDESGLYLSIGETIVDKASGEAGAEPLIEGALHAAASGDQVQKLLEPMVEQSYQWLRGETAQPQFSLAIEPVKKDFQKTLTADLKARAAKLQPCATATEVQAASVQDIYSIQCIPPGTDVNAIIKDAVSKVTNSASIFSDEVVADGTVSTEEAQDLGINDPTKNLPDTLPKLFQFMTKGQWWFIAGTILSAIGVVLLSLAWLHGLRKLGILLVINGVAILVLGLILGFVVGTLVPTTAAETTEAAVTALESAAKLILADNAGLMKLIGLVATGLGIAAIVGSTVVLRRKNPQPPKAPTPADQTKTPETKPTPAPIKKS